MAAKTKKKKRGPPLRNLNSMRGDAAEPSSCHIKVLATPGEYEAYQALAELLQEKMAAMARRLLKAEAHRVMAEFERVPRAITKQFGTRQG